MMDKRQTDDLAVDLMKAGELIGRTVRGETVHGTIRVEGVELSRVVGVRVLVIGLSTAGVRVTVPLGSVRTLPSGVVEAEQPVPYSLTGDGLAEVDGFARWQRDRGYAVTRSEGGDEVLA